MRGPWEFKVLFLLFVIAELHIISQAMTMLYQYSLKTLGTSAPSQYKDCLSQVWGFPCYDS